MGENRCVCGLLWTKTPVGFLGVLSEVTQQGTCFKTQQVF